MRWFVLLASCTGVRHAIVRDDLAGACRRSSSLDGARAERGAALLADALAARIRLSTAPLPDEAIARLLGEPPVGPVDLRTLTVDVAHPLRARVVGGGVVGAPVDPEELAGLPEEEARGCLERWNAGRVLEEALPALPPRPEPIPIDPPQARPEASPMDAIAGTAVQLGLLPLCVLGRIFSGGGGDCAIVAPDSSASVPPRPVPAPDPFAAARADREAHVSAVVDLIFAACEASAGATCHGLFLSEGHGPETLTLEVALDDADGACVTRVEVPLPQSQTVGSGAGAGEPSP